MNRCSKLLSATWADENVLHYVIATNVTATVAYRLRGKRCQAFNSDMKVRVPPPPRERFYYPDASIVCRSNPPEDSYQDEPVVIFEVLSKKTERIDKGEKLDGCLSLPSLAVYALVEQEFALVTVYRRKGANSFLSTTRDCPQSSHWPKSTSTATGGGVRTREVWTGGGVVV